MHVRTISPGFKGQNESCRELRNGQAQVQISRGEGLCRFLGGFDGCWTCFQRGLDRLLRSFKGDLTSFKGNLASF